MAERWNLVLRNLVNGNTVEKTFNSKAEALDYAEGYYTEHNKASDEAGTGKNAQWILESLQIIDESPSAF